VKWLNELLGTEIPPTLEGIRAGDVKHTLADISKAEKLLGYKPSVEFRDGLREIVDWMLKNPC
jgi:nucleoside-diphosphate-sugar epimerase